ncbi:MAG: hypothetical protein WCK67_05420 [bacterium]
MLNSLNQYLGIKSNRTIIKINPQCSINNVNSSSLKLKPSLHNDVINFKSKLFFVERLSKIPNFKQWQNKEHSESHCGPYCAANAIVWLSNNGYKKLYSKNKSALINELACYFKTKPAPIGTSTKDLCEGLDKFISDKGYRGYKIEYQGIRPGGKYGVVAMCPDLAKIKDSIEAKGMVLLNLGIYKKNLSVDGTPVYTKQYGHWVTAVGYGFNGQNYNPNNIIIHDPYNKKSENLFLDFSKLNNGKLITEKEAEPVLTDEAKGLYGSSTGIPYLNKDEMVIMNGVVMLKMPDKEI